MSAGRWEIRDGFIYEDYHGYRAKQMLVGILLIGGLVFWFGSYVIDVLDHPWKYSYLAVLASYFYGLSIILPMIFVVKVFAFLNDLTPFTNLNALLAWVGSAVYVVFAAAFIVLAYRWVAKKLKTNAITLFAMPGLAALAWMAVRWIFI